jgi:phospholipase/lecithinase/hemolysin
MRYLAAALLIFGLVLAGCSAGGDGDTPLPEATPPGDSGPSALFVLGDSLSDVGNAAAAADFLLGQRIVPPTVGLCNPADVLVRPRPCDDLFYRQSRVSDGPVAVEHLAADLGVAELLPSMHVVANRPLSGTNYAVASAKARGQGPEDLARQVDTLLLDHAPLPADALYVVIIGGNDAIDALQAEVESDASGAETGAEIVDSAVAAIAASIERLLNSGARRFVIANVPDLATLPAVRVEARSRGQEAALLAAASTVAEAFDRALRARLDEIESRAQWNSPTPPVVARFDLRDALEAARQTIASSGGGNALDACFDSDTYRHSPAADRMFHPECEPQAGAPGFAEFAFWDDLHPTGTMHAALGDALIELLDRR